MATSDNQTASPDKKPEKPPVDTGLEVTIHVNGDAVTIHRGRQPVAEIKKKAGVPLAYELAYEASLEALADDSAVTLKGGERFVAYPRDGASS